MVWYSPFPASLPPRHRRRAHPDASISSGLDPFSSSMNLRSKRRPASFALFVTSIADDALRENLYSARLSFPSSRPPRHPRLVLGASISAGLNPSSSSMALCSRRRPASIALFVTFIVDDALRKNYSRPGISFSSRHPFPSSSSSSLSASSPIRDCISTCWKRKRRRSRRVILDSFWALQSPRG